VGRLVLTRLAALLAVLALLTLTVFVIQAKLPSDPVAATLGGGASRALIQEKRHELGYDKPLYIQYERFVQRVLDGDLGTSLRTHNSVIGDIGHFGPATIELALASALLMFVLALIFGFWSAYARHGAGLARATMIAAASAPTFFVAILLILLFYSRLGWLPSSGRTNDLSPVSSITGLVTIDALLHGNFGVFSDALRHLILPSVVVALGPAVAIGRVLRGSLIDVMRQDHIRTARSKGLGEIHVLLRHAFRNSMTPVLAMTGLQVGLLLTGVIVVETVFAWPGLGLYTARALLFDDFPAVTGVTLVLGVVYVAVNAVVDILQLVADPRMKQV
jgi:peptide/nickel transport system permease protein